MPPKLQYYKSVNYDIADPAKRIAQQEAAATAANLPFDFAEVPGTRGESAHVVDIGEMYIASVQEGLGTKSIVARTVYLTTGRSYFREVAQDSVASIINDLISVGATPAVLNAYWSSSSYDWLADPNLATDFITGWHSACDEARVTWGGGETQSLPGIIIEDELEFAGSAWGAIKDKRRLVQGGNLQPDDAIVILESSGVHANGISLIREIATQLPNGYASKLADGTTLGEAVLVPTHLYARVISALLEAEIDVHYLSNITGHGWRKLMRAEPDFTYRMHQLPPVNEIFKFIAEAAVSNNAGMYDTFNMGAGYAVYLPADRADTACSIAADCGLQAWNAGTVENGQKQVIIDPLTLTFGAASLGVRR